MSKIDGHVIVKLYDLLNEYQDERAKIDEILSDFECHLNKDVEKFLRNSAVLYEQQGVSRTSLVLSSYKNNPVIAGYFSLSNKSIVVKHNKVSATLKKRIAKFGVSDGVLKQITLSSPLRRERYFHNQFSTNAQIYVTTF